MRCTDCGSNDWLGHMYWCPRLQQDSDDTTPLTDKEIGNIVTTLVIDGAEFPNLFDKVPSAELLRFGVKLVRAALAAHAEGGAK